MTFVSRQARAAARLAATAALAILCLATNGCIALAAGAGGAGGYAIAKSDRSLGTIASDASITSRVKTQLLRDDRISGFDINVDTRQGVVTLHGHVESAPLVQRAKALTASVKGVRSVHSNLAVIP